MTATPSSDFPDAAERARLNAAFAATAAETGFWDDRGCPAPWPDDIEDWILETHQTDPQGPIRLLTPHGLKPVTPLVDAGVHEGAPRFNPDSPIADRRSPHID